VPLTIVHCADVHLETAFTEVRGGPRRRAALADGFARAIDLALERRADVLTIGGDLFEVERAGPQTLRFLSAQFSRFGRPVFIAPGNHDPYVAGGLYARGALPPNVRVFAEATWAPYPLAAEVTLYGFAHTPAEPGPPFAQTRFDRPGVHIALVHGSDADRCPPRKRITAPFTLREVAASGAQLLLTGHYHGGYVSRTADGAASIAYPGSLEPIKFGERGAHGVLVVRVEAGAVELEAVELARTRLVDLTCNLDGAASEHAVLAAIERTLEGSGANDYVRLRLAGRPETGTRIDTALIAERFGASLGTFDVSDETIAYDYESIAREPTVRGRVVRDLLELALTGNAESAAEAHEALRYALAAFEGEVAPCD
jgi:DNA repair protein SbcD/Mre11